jgi:hypothetical protein
MGFLKIHLLKKGNKYYLSLLIPSFNTVTLASSNVALPDDGESVHQMV